MKLYCCYVGFVCKGSSQVLKLYWYYVGFPSWRRLNDHPLMKSVITTEHFSSIMCECLIRGHLFFFFYTAQPLMCHQCGDIGGVIPCLTSEVISDHLAPCPTGYFCMTDLYHYFDGSINIYKRYIASLHANAGRFNFSSIIATFIFRMKFIIKKPHVIVYLF